jgi:hypothetical protein
MAYDHFSYDVEKAWCNQDIQKVITDARRADKSAAVSADAIYGAFERLARINLDTSLLSIGQDLSVAEWRAYGTASGRG